MKFIRFARPNKFLYLQKRVNKDLGKLSLLSLLTFWKMRNFLIMTKKDNHFVISLDLGYVLHHYNAEKVLIYSSDVKECVHLREDRI